jgi:choline-sulfatase
MLWAGSAQATSAEEAWYGLVGEQFSVRPEFAFVENDPNLPNVLIYGDSISIGYTQRVRGMLKGRANVYRLHCNGGASNSFIPKMNAMHETMQDVNLDRPWAFQWDIIHFNVGLHDLKYVSETGLDKANGKQVSSIPEYQRNLRDIAVYLERRNPGAKLIFSTTTPVPEGEPGRFAGDAERYNEAALEVLSEFPRIETNDLFTFTRSNQADWFIKPGNVHFNDTGKNAQGDEVARVLSADWKKPNILFIFSDDQAHETLGVRNRYGLKTPNLDRLAESGVDFTHAFNQGSYAPAVCVASRTMLNTGSFLWRAATFSKLGNPKKGNRNNPAFQQEYSVERKTPEAYWPEYMKRAGYETYMSGKWHISEVEPGEIFDHVSNIRPGMPKQTDRRYDRSFTPGQPDTWSPYDEQFGGYWKGGKHWSEVLADDALAFLEMAGRREEPFFMYLAFNAPHDPRQSPQRFVDMYPLEDTEVPENFLPEYPYNEYAGSGRRLRDERLAPFPRTEHSVKVNRQEYFAIVSHMDEQIGRILEALRASGQADNTYIFFTSDHGLSVGDHGFMGKQNMYDASMRVPLLVAGPGIQAGKSVDAHVYLQDVMATSLELAGLEKPAQVDFHSLLPLATGKTDRSEYEAIYGAYFGSQRMIRTDRYKMIIYPTANRVRLYDLEADPHEKNDLAEDREKQVDLMRRLLVQLTRQQEAMGDPVDVAPAFENFMQGIPPLPLPGLN